MSRVSILFFILIFLSCTKSGTDSKIYKTTNVLNRYGGTQVFSDVDSYSHEIIATIPFKEKVEIVDNKKYRIPNDKIVSSNYSKIKYKDKIGYINNQFLSDRDEIPFVDNLKFDYTLNEFSYDKEKIIKTIKLIIKKEDFFKGVESYYYIDDDPQIYSIYSKDCDNNEIKKIVVIIVSKIHPYDNYLICLLVKEEKLINNGGQHGNVNADEIERIIIRLKNPPDCCGDC